MTNPIVVNNYVHDPLIHNTNAAEEVLPILLSELNAESVLDVGCGLGTWLAVAKKLGVPNVTGIDGNSADQSLMSISNDEFEVVDLTQPYNFNKKFDLTLCLEVAEHLEDKHARNLIEILVGSSNVILFSAAIPNQGGQNHINEQWPEYWNSYFKDFGFKAYDIRPIFWQNCKIEWWYRQNMILYSTLDLSSKFLQVQSIANLIHPELFQLCNLRLQENENKLNKLIYNPKVGFSTRLLLKSVMKKLGFKF